MEESESELVFSELDPAYERSCRGCKTCACSFNDFICKLRGSQRPIDPDSLTASKFQKRSEAFQLRDGHQETTSVNIRSCAPICNTRPGA